MGRFIKGTKNLVRHIISFWKARYYPNIHSTAQVSDSAKVYNPENIIMYENARIGPNSIIMNTRANFIMKTWSAAAFGLTVVTGNHLAVPGLHLIQVTDKVKDELDVMHKMDKDVIVDEDTWLGSNVTLLSGAHVGRGCVIGSGTIVRGNIPPYSILIGNPAKIIGFRFTPEEVATHEAALYSPEERIDPKIIEKNYNKYFYNRTDEIKRITKL